MRIRFLLAAGVIAASCLLLPAAQSQPSAAKGKTGRKLEPVAETKLLMEGLAGPNLRGLAKLLRDKPADAEGWSFARGQALLIAETGNLLLIRPPRTAAREEQWMRHSSELRDAGAALARATAAKDYPGSRTALANLANSCNRCHSSFRVATRIDPFSDE